MQTASPIVRSLLDFHRNQTPQNVGAKFRRLLEFSRRPPNFDMWLGGDAYFDSLFE